MGLEQQLHSLIQKIWVTKQLPQVEIQEPKLKLPPMDEAWPVFYEPINEDAVFLARFAGFVSEQVPEDPEACRFLLKFARECCLTRTSLINAYIYLFKTRNTIHYNWRLVFVNCVLLAERMWEDNYIHPAFIRQRYTTQACASKFTSIQLELLNLLEWRMNISETEFQQISNAICSRSEDAVDRARLPQRPLPALPKISVEGFRRRSNASTAGSVSSLLTHPN